MDKICSSDEKRKVLQTSQKFISVILSQWNLVIAGCYKYVRVTVSVFQIDYMMQINDIRFMSTHKV